MRAETLNLVGNLQEGESRNAELQVTNVDESAVGELIGKPNLNPTRIAPPPPKKKKQQTRKNKPNTCRAQYWFRPSEVGGKKEATKRLPRLGWWDQALRDTKVALRKDSENFKARLGEAFV